MKNLLLGAVLTLGAITMLPQEAHAKFLSSDPVTFMSSGQNPSFFNRYAYCYNDPINCTDPDGQYGRGTGFTNSQWRSFNSAQKGAARRLNRTAGRLERRAARFERKGREGADALRSRASALRASSNVLSDDGTQGFVAHGKSEDHFSNETVVAHVGVNNRSEVHVNVDHDVFGSDGDTDKAQSSVAHEGLHSAGFDDQMGSNGQIGYSDGSDAQKDAFNELKGTDTGNKNPDNIIDGIFD